MTSTSTSTSASKRNTNVDTNNTDTNTNVDSNNNNSNNDVISALDQLMEFLGPNNNKRSDVKYEAVKIVSKGMADRSQALTMIEKGFLKPLLRIATGASVAIEVAKEQQDEQEQQDSSAILMEIASSTLALQTILYVTSSAGEIEELVNTCVEHLLDLKAIPRFVEFILELPSDVSKLSKSTKKIINTTLSILVNLTRTERGAIELVGTTLPEEAVYNNANQDNEEEGEEPRIVLIEDDDEEEEKKRHHDNNDNDNDKHVRIKPSMELLLDRFMKTNSSSSSYNNTTNNKDNAPYVDLSIFEPNEWDQLLFEYDPYQHFASLLMNATQVKGGRKFLTRIPRTTTNNNTSSTSSVVVGKQDKQPPPQLSVLQKLVPILRQKHSTTNSNSTNPFRRRGIAGMIRNICLDRENDQSWWLLNICEVITPLLLPLMGPEELELDDKKGMDPDLWLDGPDKQRDIDSVTRLYCVESILALLATGRINRKYIRKAQTYTVLKQCDMVEDCEEVSDRIQECVNFLRRDEEGTYEGSSDHQIYKSTIDDTNDNGDDTVNSGLLLKADPSIPIPIPIPIQNIDENFDEVD